jgi:O-antigen/teichoic acid export membrane protein
MLRKSINNLTKPAGSTLSQRTARGGMWVFLLRIVQQLFGLARLVIIARILSPNDFGLMGIALLAMATLETFSQTGFQQALIQKKEDIKSYLDAAWTVLIVRGFILFAILYLVAPYIAVFFNVPEAKPIIQVIGFSVLLQAFTNIGVIYFQKELEFNKEFLYQFAGTLADFIVAVSAVLIIGNVWALVFGLLAGNAARCFVSYLIHPYRPHLSSDLGKVKELFGFGKWIMGSSILVFLLTQGDDIFVGKLLGATALGFYQLAYKISNMPATEISHLIAIVTFPAYSKLQDNLLKLKETYLKILQLTAFLSIPIAGLIFILAIDFTTIFLGEKWIPMVPAMQVLALYGALRAIGATTGVVFMAVGKPKIRTKIQFFQLILLGILIYPLTINWGILGASIAVTAYALIFNFVAVYKVLKIVRSDVRKALKIVVFPIMGTVLMMCASMFIKIYIFNKNTDILSFPLLIVSSLFLYLIVMYLFEIFFNYGNIQLMQNQFKSFAQK